MNRRSLLKTVLITLAIILAAPATIVFAGGWVTEMPKLDLSRAEIEALIAFLKPPE